MKKRALLTKAKAKHLRGLVGKFDNVKILVIGDFILDQYVFGNVSRVSPEAPVPVVEVDVAKEKYVPGGSLNVGNNILALEATVFPCGVVGRDIVGRMLLKLIRAESIDIGGVVVDNNRPTTLKTRVLAHSQQVVRIDRESKREITLKDFKELNL